MFITRRRREQPSRSQLLAAQVASLFAAGEQGVWYDPSDFSTLFQDSAGTTPVTAVGQPVGRILDKSGRGNHAAQTTAGSRPLLQVDGAGRFYLDFDGSDDFLVTGNIDFSTTDKMTVFVGLTKDSDAAAGIVIELSAAVASNPGSFSFVAPSGATPTISAILNSTAQGSVTLSGVAAPATLVVTVRHDIAQSSITTETTLRVNGALTAPTGGGSVGTGNFGAAYPLYFGRRGNATNPFNGRLYGWIVRGALSNAAQVDSGEAWVNSKTGAF